MKLVVQVKLLPTPEQAAALEATLRACNTAASDVAAVARETDATATTTCAGTSTRDQGPTTGWARRPPSTSSRRSADAYTTLKANLRAGNYGKPGSKRRRKVETNPVAFRWNAAQPYDARMLSWQADARTVSIWTVAGRLKGVAYHRVRRPAQGRRHPPGRRVRPGPPRRHVVPVRHRRGARAAS